MVNQATGLLIFAAIGAIVLALWFYVNVQESKQQGQSAKEGLIDAANGCFEGTIKFVIVAVVVIAVVWAFDGLTSCSGHGPELENWRH
jgi:hypothetical protein